jgi:hypothetical protein
MLPQHLRGCMRNPNCYWSAMAPFRGYPLLKFRGFLLEPLNAMIFGRANDMVDWMLLIKSHSDEARMYGALKRTIEICL